MHARRESPLAQGVPASSSARRLTTGANSTSRDRRPHANRPAVDAEQAHRTYAATHDPRLKAALLQWHSPLAVALATLVAGRGEALDNLRQVALLALLRALRSYDPRRGAEFSSYAMPSIVGTLKRHLRDRGWLVRPPRRLQETYLIVSAPVEALQAELGPSPTVYDIVAHTVLPVPDVIESLRAGTERRAEPFGPAASWCGDDALGAALSDNGHQAPAAEERVLARELLGLLRDREREVVELSFWRGLTQGQIATRLGVSQTTVSRRRRRALERLAVRQSTGTTAA